MRPSGTILIVVTATYLGGLAGCFSGKHATAVTQDEEHQHYPQHWPHSLDRALSRLQELSQRITWKLSQVERLEAVNGVELTADREAYDLLRWLPELAGDSDLQQPAFDRVDQWSLQMLRHFDSESRPDLSVNAESWNVIKQLKEDFQQAHSENDGMYHQVQDAAAEGNRQP